MNSTSQDISTNHTLLVFIVEDSDMYALMLEHRLGRSRSIQFLKYNSGEECIRNLEKNPDLIILDYNLPGMNGLETLKRIKHYNYQLPVVILSAQQDLKVAIRMFGEGAFDYLTKDADTLNELNKVIDRVSLLRTMRKPA